MRDEEEEKDEEVSSDSLEALIEGDVPEDEEDDPLIAGEPEDEEDRWQ